MSRIQAEYYENPQWVWMAIYFPFFMILLCLLCCNLIKNKIPFLAPKINNGNNKNNHGSDSNYNRTRKSIPSGE
jgi:hypothetical protein